MDKEKAMVPTNDYVFRRIFGHKGNEEITKGLIKAILNRDIQKIKLDVNPILEKDLIDDKIGILDIKAILDNNTVCDIEMQLLANRNIEKRIMFYWSKLYFSGIEEGKDYNNLNKTIVILIANFELDVIKDIGKYHTKWEIREEEYSEIILTNVLEIHIIELPKLMKQKENRYKDKELDIWLRFILNPDDIGGEEMKENRVIELAKQEFDNIGKDEHEAYLAHLRLKYILDSKDIEAYGYDKGIQEGIQKGKKEGIQEKQKEIVLNMHKKKFDIDAICDITNLSKKEVEKIINENTK